MADVDSAKIPSLSEQYLLKEKVQESKMATKPAEDSEVQPVINSPAEDTVEETPTVVASVIEAAAEVVSAVSDSADGESNEATEGADSAPSEENTESAEPDNDETEETPEIKIETAPADFRFPTTNQTRHCFTRYIEYHRCVAAKGDDAPECDRFAKYYRALCPGEWVDRWNEQRENGTFPGPL